MSIRILFIIILMQVLDKSAIGQLPDASEFLHDGIKSAPFIFEGTVLSSTGYWNTDSTMIYTSHIVKVDLVIRECPGVISKDDSTCIIVTVGGIVGTIIATRSHSLSFGPGQKGIFFAMPTVKPQNPEEPPSANLLLEPFNNIFIEYYFDESNPAASYRSVIFESHKEVYNYVIARMKQE